MDIQVIYKLNINCFKYYNVLRFQGIIIYFSKVELQFYHKYHHFHLVR